MNVFDGGEISSSTFFGSGRGGNIEVDIADNILLDNLGGIFSFSIGAGHAGQIQIESHLVDHPLVFW